MNEKNIIIRQRFLSLLLALGIGASATGYMICKGLPEAKAVANGAGAAIPPSEGKPKNTKKPASTPKSTASPVEKKAELSVANGEVKIPDVFDEELLKKLLDGIRNGETETEGFSCFDPALQLYLGDFIVERIDEFWCLRIYVDTVINDEGAKITRAEIYSFDYDNDEYYGFIQTYSYKNGEKAVDNNMMFYGPIGGDKIYGFENMDVDDIIEGIEIFKSAPFLERKEAIDAYGDEMDKKYLPPKG